MTTPDARALPGHATGAARVILQLEGAAVLAVAAAVYSRLDASWTLFAALFLLPDLSMLGYLAGPRIGAAFYNAGHSYLGPLALGLAGLLQSSPLLQQIAVIWIAHVGFDRAMGYGLKSVAGFGFTHLGLKGKAARQSAQI